MEFPVRLLADASAASLAAALVTPPIAILDRAVVEKVAHCTPLWQSLRAQVVASLSPRTWAKTFGRPFGIIWALYAATYTAANGSETVARHSNLQAAAVGTIVFVATLAVNVPLGIQKDARFAQAFGCQTRAPSVRDSLVRAGQLPVAPTSLIVPRPAVAAFLLRDSLTIFGSFTLPGLIMGSSSSSQRSHMSPQMQAIVGQLTVPALMQVVATPVHLVGLDMYNRQGGSVTLLNRLNRLPRQLTSSTVARCIRIIPGFGCGCIVNAKLRTYFQDRWSSAVGR
ncbi:hypothetical protein QQS21_002520 [Conoideocrella luteorostrata]|uniref:Uncharacterized protein n=1 Tax=Conoideocrella luteorostrata TaxID=1105319 RepID=A0AAJ0G1A1_9HYPO|nr:hypothetical protein QQS21_002520 [Conoideocrella luteorostrata]